MNVTVFGTCRLDLIKHNNLNNRINYTHSTKEVVQMIGFLTRTLSIPSPYDIPCFRTALLEKRGIECTEAFHSLFLESDVCVVEICSRKTYLHQGYYLHHLSVDKRTSEHNLEAFHEYQLVVQTDEEIEQDLLEIKRLLYPKKIVVVSHYNSLRDGIEIPARKQLIDLLSRLCTQHSIPFVDPTVALSYPQEKVMTGDLGHYTDFGRNEIANHLNQVISSLVIPSLAVERPVCIHKYLTKCQTVEQAPGFADFLRGTLALYKMCQRYNYRFALDRSHPVFSYLKEPLEPFTETLTETHEEIGFNSYDDKYKKVVSYFDGTSFQIFTNCLYTEKDGFTKNWGPIDKEERVFLKSILTPSLETENRLKHIFIQEYGITYGEPFTVIHIRTGDYNIHHNHLDQNWLVRYFDTIKECVERGSGLFVLISDCGAIAKQLVERIPRLFYWDNQKTHIGDLINHEGNALLDTLCDFFILSKASTIFFTHDSLSGFSHIQSILNDIPYIKLYPKKPVSRFKRMTYSYSP